MPTKKSKPRRSSAIKRKHRFKKGYTHHIVPVKYKVTLDEGTERVKDWLQQQDYLEQLVIAELQAHGVPQEMHDHYLSYARRKRSVADNFTAATRAMEFQNLRQEFILRGLDPTVIDAVEVVVPFERYWRIGYSKLGVDTRLG